MARFDYVRPHSLGEALDLLAEVGLTSRPLAGGTDVLVYLRHHDPPFNRLVDISRLPELKTIRQEGTMVHVGTAVTFAEAVRSQVLLATVPLLVEACGSVGSPQIRNLGTLGGNVINAAACADSLPPLVCLGAIAHLASRAGQRQIPVTELVLGPSRSDLRPGELLTHFTFEVPPAGVRSTFIKLGRRNAQSISRLSLAAMGRTTAGGVVDFVRLTVGAATPRIKRFAEVESLLLGQPLDEALLAEAGRKTTAVMVEATGRRWSTEYKELAILALAERSLRRVLQNGPAA